MIKSKCFSWGNAAVILVFSKKKIKKVHVHCNKLVYMCNIQCTSLSFPAADQFYTHH